jgi:hypothetical protein
MDQRKGLKRGTTGRTLVLILPIIVHYFLTLEPTLKEGPVNFLVIFLRLGFERMLALEQPHER